MVHIHAEGPAFFCWIPKLFGKRVICTIHGLDWDREKWRGSVASKFIRGGEKNAVKYADEIIVLSKDVQKYFLETYGRETHFIPNGVNRPEVREAKLITDHFGLEKDSYILFLGRLVPEKGIRYLVEAFKNVKTDKKLVIAGGSSDTDSFMEELKELAKGDNRILFTGFVQGAMLDELYSNAYIYTLPSDLEGMPLSLLEAMSYGNCCLVSDIPECAEVVEDKAYRETQDYKTSILSTANTLKLSKASVTSYLPYKKGVYFQSTEKEKISVGAERQRRFRAMKRWRANPTEENFWGVVVSYAGVGFKTYSGLPFSYEVRKGRNGEYTKELWIDRREKSKSLAWSSVLLALKNIKGEVVDAQAAYERLSQAEDELYKTNEQIHYAGQYLSTKDVQQQFAKAIFKKKFRAEHSKELDAYAESVKYFREENDGKLPSLKSLKKRKEELIKEIVEKKKAYAPLKEESRRLEIASDNVYSIFQKTNEMKSDLAWKREWEAKVREKARQEQARQEQRERQPKRKKRSYDMSL